MSHGRPGHDALGLTDEGGYPSNTKGHPRAAFDPKRPVTRKAATVQEQPSVCSPLCSTHEAAWLFI